jgi:hypothetical protein
MPPEYYDHHHHHHHHHHVGTVASGLRAGSTMVCNRALHAGPRPGTHRTAFCCTVSSWDSDQDCRSRGRGGCQVDVEWYLTQQIMPPISRLCEPIEGTSPAILAERLGLDKSKFGSHGAHNHEDDDWGFTPMCRMEDAER